MGKRLEDLHLRNEPLEPEDDRDAPWLQFTQEIDELAASGCYDWALDTLLGIRETVERTRLVTSGQRRAVENIQTARGRADGWRRRYEGYGRR